MRPLVISNISSNIYARLRLKNHLVNLTRCKGKQVCLSSSYYFISPPAVTECRGAPGARLFLWQPILLVTNLTYYPIKHDSYFACVITFEFIYPSIQSLNLTKVNTPSFVRHIKILVILLYLVHFQKRDKIPPPRYLLKQRSS